MICHGLKKIVKKLSSRFVVGYNDVIIVREGEVVFRLRNSLLHPDPAHTTAVVVIHLRSASKQYNDCSPREFAVDGRYC